MPLSELALTQEDLSLNKFYIHRIFFYFLFSVSNSTTDLSTKFKLGFALSVVLL